MLPVNLLTKAILFAARAHDGQTRKGNGLPYIVHPMEAMTFAAQHGVTDEVVLSAIVNHDVPEDTKYTLEDLAREVSVAVAEVVSFVTKPSNLSKSEQRKWAIDALRRGPPAARIVKMADRLSNIRDMSALSWRPEAKRAYAEEASLIASLGAADCPTLSRTLADTAITLVGNEFSR